MTLDFNLFGYLKGAIITAVFEAVAKAVLDDEDLRDQIEAVLDPERASAWLKEQTPFAQSYAILQIVAERIETYPQTMED